jgi:hypothetical protein
LVAIFAKSEDLVKAVERSLWSVAIAVLVTGDFFTPQLVTSSSSADQGSPAPAAAMSSAEPAGHVDEVSEEEREPGDGPSGFTDLYGNEVTDAVATYTFDQSGSLYELHSPQTELPRLGIPKS